MDQYIGKMLDNRYEILERIGMGGMAVVYKAKCHRLNRLVAIKILKSDLAQDADFRRRFNAESQAVAQLSHPNIVSVYDVSKGGDIEYIVMELIDGITLKQYMEKRGRLNWRESLHFITQIMRGLSHAHSRGIVHRDIKPQNIMVLRDGSVKVADFGIACLENSAQTLTQEALGSVHYISPEQARGDRTDARSDIYSAGVVLYEMLSGRLPFEGDSAVSVAIQHLSSIPLPPREVNPEIPEQLELICMKAMAPDINRRYGSADEMILDLEAFRKNPDTNLDFEMRDLRPEEVDEPTMKLRTSGPHGSSIAVSHRSTSVRERERRRDYDDYDPPERGVSKGRVALVVVACVLALALAGVLFRSILGSFQPVAPEQYTVPSVLGYTLENAGNLPEVKDIFTITQQDEALYSNEYAPGEIAKQEPAAGETRKGDNLEIQVWISAGQETGNMLNLKDRSMAEVTVMMQDLKKKFNLTIEEAEREYDDEVTEGHVISFEPAEGSVLKNGDTIRVVLSKGPQPVHVIPVNNISVDVARAMLQGFGLDIGEVTYENSSEVDAGLIIRQDPASGEVAPGTKINVVVSDGPEEGVGDIMTYSYTIPLPTDRDSAVLQIFQDTECLLNEPVDCRPGSYFIPLEGTGTAHITVYIDGELFREEDITFGT
ncbi:Stk1 family PASTA domain-containing Ser/Thr kinase [uncultured Oscillibacter sp.]|uniref:Stk1 family PASTA domain-containing Ser/Thr kinase n=1 Tax=uncultured Oscillibacter sp. TaxID=876091 RepID=UPI0025F4398C|nr:Stk1 family PASTA domain-containing Ser/Thr kinase [uncultured Oscillibacter sp.]